MSHFKGETVKKHEIFGREELRGSALERDQGARFEDTLWRTAGESALFQMGRMEHELDLPELACAFYGLSSGSLDIPLVSTFAAHSVIARDLLLRFGSEEQKARYLKRMESGELRGAICNSEAGAGTDLKKIRSEMRAGSETHGHLRFHKPCVTNGYAGSLYFVSAWEHVPGREPALAIYIVEGDEAESANMAVQMSAFRTGLTGAVRGDLGNFPFQERRLPGNPLSVFKHCFNLERLFIGVIAAGALKGMEREAHGLIRERERHTGRPESHQWIHEKVVRIASTRLTIEALVGSALQARTLKEESAGLAAIKLLVNEEGHDAAMAFFELSGHAGVLSHHFAQKLLRDFTAFRFFGGTTELQKITLYHEIMGSHDAEDPTSRLRKAS